MGRKKGVRSKGAALIDAQIIETIVNGQKTQREAAQELGINEATVCRRINKAMNQEDIKALVERSKRRLAEMLGRCDGTYLDILSNKNEKNFDVRLKASTNVYKQLGVLEDAPQIAIQNNITLESDSRALMLKFIAQSNTAKMIDLDNHLVEDNSNDGKPIDPRTNQ
jgi:hypothetical protein